jgi:hypothetical protein
MINHECSLYAYVHEKIIPKNLYNPFIKSIQHRLPISFRINQSPYFSLLSSNDNIFKHLVYLNMLNILNTYKEKKYLNEIKWFYII